MQNCPPCGVSIANGHSMTSQLRQEIMSTIPTTALAGGYNGSHNQKMFTDTDFDSEFGEDVDEDFIDEECQFSFENFLQKRPVHGNQKDDTDTERLLAFLALVNTDIHKYFGKNKGSDDACDVYQDKWTSGKSGRELYYADLMKIAQGIDTDDPKSPSNSDAATRDQKNGDKKTHARYTGRPDPSVGLGPLEGLFQYGITTGHGVAKTGGNGKRQQPQGKRSRGFKAQDSTKRAKTLLPMLERKLPESFWREPKETGRHVIYHAKLNYAVAHSGHTNNKVLIDTAGNKNVNPKRLKDQSASGGVDTLGQTSVPPDFADLLDSWSDATHMAASCTSSGQQQHYGVVTRGQHVVPTTTTT